MRKLSALLLLVVTVSLSCKKGNSDPNYHLTFTIDGVNKKFNIYAMGFQSTLDGYHGVALGGAESTVANSATFGLEISNLFNNNNPVVAGTYNDDGTDFEVLASYQTEAEESFEAGTTLYQETVRTGTAINNHLKVVITSIGNGSIKGTFSGDFHLEADPAAAKKVITNGEFYLPLTSTP
ncbi:MAG TPA: hypothetical protein VHN59_07295 [Chitinophagaceae bacterium]|nr:hypothetical protein [Chitinophagaceae bacterium]